jgi:excisionase family DNA binding protein
MRTRLPGDRSVPVLLKVEEVAEILRTSSKAVYAMAERGALAGVVRLGRRLLFDRDELIRWIDEGREPSPNRRGR